MKDKYQNSNILSTLISETVDLMFLVLLNQLQRKLTLYFQYRPTDSARNWSFNRSNRSA